MEYLRLMIRTHGGRLQLPPPPAPDITHEFSGLRLLTLTGHSAFHCPYCSHCRRRPAEEFSRLDYKIQKFVLLRTDLISLCEAKRWISESPLLKDSAEISESPATENGASTLPNDAANDEKKEEEEVVTEEYWSCGLCKVIVSSEKTWNTHLEGRKHKRKEAAVVKKQSNPETMIEASEYQKKFEFWCEACEVGTHSLDVMSNHRNGKRHVSRIKELIAQPWL